MWAAFSDAGAVGIPISIGSPAIGHKDHVVGWLITDTYTRNATLVYKRVALALLPHAEAPIAMAVAGDCQALVRRPRDVRHDVCSLRVGARGPMEPGVHVEPAELPADCSDARADGGVLEALFEADGAERGARLAMAHGPR